LEKIVDSVEDGIYSVDRERRIISWNKAAEKITGYSAEEMLGSYCSDNLLNHIDSQGNPLCVSDCPMFATMTDGDEREAEVMLRHKNGHRVPVSVKTIPARKGDEIIGAVEIFSQKSSLQYDDSFIETLSDLATKDPLTGLPNRMLLENQLHYRLREAKWLGTRVCAVLIELDNFRAFSSYYKNSVGETLLKCIAESFRNNLKGRDIIGRWNDQIFLGVFEYQAGSSGLLELSERVRALVTRSGVMYSGKFIGVTASLGMAVSEAGDNVKTLVSRADDMLYKSRRRGGNCSSFNASQNSEPSDRVMF
jgi:diguanylate cyclase (GGDEF)-like protein/PAS domain S-box-containing protein